MARKHALTIDLEDWHHAELVRPHAGDAPVTLVEEATRPILDLLERHDVRATFFVLGDVARRLPELVQRIHAAGHEIACHAMSHRTLWELGRDGLARELEEFRKTIDGVLGAVPVRGFRAPTFSLDDRTAWAVDLLLANGFEYDSSIFPIWNGVYGVPGAPIAPYRVTSADLRRPAPEGLIEFPLTVLPALGLNLPFSGGFYLRVTPAPLLFRALRRVAASRSFVIYLHPWEASSTTPRPPLPLRDRLITYTGARSVLPKLERMLGEFTFTTLGNVIDEQVKPALAASA